VETEKETKEDKKTIKGVLKDCWNRRLVWASWMCDPEGPSAPEIITKLLLRWLGVISIIAGLFGWIISFPSITSLPNVSILIENIFGGDINLFRYIASALVFFGSGFYFIGKHAKRLELKTAVFNEEIDNIISEVRRSSKENTLFIEEVNNEIVRLKYFKEKPSEVSQLRLIALRKLHIDTIKDFEKLKAYAESDIFDYKHFTGEEDQTYLDYRKEFNRLYWGWDLDVNHNSTIMEFRVRLKELRNDLSWEKYWSGQGEAILESITHWSIPAIFALTVMGVTPLLNEPIFLSELNLINWGFLGMAGAILFTAGNMRKLDFAQVGEEEGNQELRKMLLGMVIGAISAILLYASIRSGIFGGKALPKFEAYNSGISTDIVVANSLSMFWAIAAGYSAKLVGGMFGSAERVTGI